MAICNDVGLIVDTLVLAVEDQDRRRLKMLELWVSEIEPEFSFDSIYAPGRYRSTVHWNGYGGTYSYRRSGFWTGGIIRSSLSQSS